MTSSFSAALCSASVESFPPENRTASFIFHPSFGNVLIYI
jgi:hypothetical protein